MYDIAQTISTKMTYSDYAGLDDGIRYELIKGELRMSHAPTVFHQRTNYKLIKILGDYVDSLSLGWVFEAPTDVVLDRYNTVQPDVIFIAKESASKIQENAIFGAPELVAEIISPSSLIADRYTKKELYEKSGVREYWLVDIGNKTIEVFELTDGKFSLFSYISVHGSVNSKLFPDLSIAIEEILPDIVIVAIRESE